MVLPFGVASGTYLLTKVVGSILNSFSIDNKGILCVSYCDDIIIESPVNRDVKTEFLKMATTLNLFLNQNKIQHGPCFEFVGYLIDLQSMTIRIRPKLRQKIIEQIDQIIQTCCLVELEKLKGRLEFITNVTKSRTKLFHLNNFLAENTQKLRAGQGFERINVSREVMSELMYWKDLRNLKTYRISGRHNYYKSLIMYSDASASRWAITYLNRALACKFSEQTINCTIFEKEMYALRMLIENVPEATNVLCCVDNMAVYNCYHRRQAKSSERANADLDKIFELIESKDLWIDLVYILLYFNPNVTFL